MTTSAYVLIIGLLVAIIAISIWTTTPSSDDSETALIANNNEGDRTPKLTQPSQPSQPTQPVRQPSQPGDSTSAGSSRDTGSTAGTHTTQPGGGTDTTHAPGESTEHRRVTHTAPPCRFPLTYTVKSGDMLSTIAKKYYNCDGAGITQLCVLHIGKANPGLNINDLRIGQKVKIPALTAELAARIGGDAPAAVTHVEPTAESRVARPQGPDLSAYKIYIVKRGDSFSKIARVQLGDEDKAKQLFELNKRLGLAENINEINEGQQVVLGYK